ncbi:MAG: hypothetical protein BMS9Abin26_2197 [Gammaproteobacteria bacterium]|nr:MAG: hypothetical protein BMS9Abin26_2197 [Gammaproteobacteria bacterium]
MFAARWHTEVPEGEGGLICGGQHCLWRELPDTRFALNPAYK